MQTIYEANLAEIMPESISGDEKFQAIAQALDPLIKNFSADTKLPMHLPRLDELEGLILDLLANQFHVDNFDSINLSDEQKKNFIRQSIAHHRRKGTVAAVEDVANQFFQDATVEELGNFYFKIKTREYLSTQEAFQTFIRMLFDAKNVRSWLKSIDMDLSPPPTQIHAANPIVADAAVNIDLRKPKDSLVQIHAANPIIADSVVTIDLKRPRRSKALVKVGAPLVISGNIFINRRNNHA